MNIFPIKKSRGFTLIELLVVISIIGMLSSVVLVSLASTRDKARDAKRISSLKEIQKAMELYASTHNNQYPDTGGWVCYKNPTITSNMIINEAYAGGGTDSCSEHGFTDGSPTLLSPYLTNLNTLADNSDFSDFSLIKTVQAASGMAGAKYLLLYSTAQAYKISITGIVGTIPSSLLDPTASTPVKAVAVASSPAALLEAFPED